MAFEPLIFSKSWNDPEDFPTYEPNEEQVRADLQLLHDEAKEAINRLVEELNDPSAAGKLPFAPAEGLNAETVQAAIEEVYRATRDAAAALIVNGSVSKQHLSEELLKRIYGGRMWLSYDEPTPQNDPNADFPVGQLWLCRPMSLKNILQEQWEISGGEESEPGSLEFITDGTQDYLTVSQYLENVGTAGQTVLVAVKMGESSSTIQELSLVVNGAEYEAEDGVLEFELDQSGSLELGFRGQWESPQEGEKICVETLAAVLVEEDQVGRAKARLENLGNFSEETFPMTVWLQTASGVWEKVMEPVHGVSLGGTGVSQLEQGTLLYGTGTDTMAVLPAEDSGILQMVHGSPQWVQPAELAESAGYLQTAQGTYLGTGEEQTISLPVTPCVLLITAEDGKETACIIGEGKNGGKFETFSGNLGIEYWAYVELQGSTLTCTVTPFGAAAEKMKAKHMNRQDVEYRWLALY